VRLISFHHRLGGMTGHRYPEALGLVAAAPARGMDFILFINEHADASVRAAFPEARAVLHCPVFRMEWSFDARTADFVAMLHQHIDPVVRKDDWLFVTTGTQCEVRALSTWIAETPAEKRPWALAVFHSDRWNRYGPEERDRQIGEFRVVASELAQLDADAARRLLLGAVSDELCQELSGLLGTTVRRIPQVLPGSGYIPLLEKPAGELVTVGILGGARPEKGSYLIPAIVRESRRLGQINFAIQLVNEQLSETDFTSLCRLAEEPGIRIAYGPLDQVAYRSLLASCDIVLFPYERIPYRQRPSGIFVEAAFTGRPVVVPTETWMSRQLDAGTVAGTAYDGDDATAIAEALIRAVDTLPTLAALAKRQAPVWQRTMTLDAFLDWVEGEIRRRKVEARNSNRTFGGGIGRAAFDWFASLLSGPKGARNQAADCVEFMLLAEAGILEAQALLLCESIRCFAGAYSRCPITVISPRRDRRPSFSTRRKLDELQAEYLPIEVDSCCPEYGTSYRVHSAAHVARRSGPPILVQLDSDTIFLAEPDFSLIESDAAARPVDVKGMCTTGPGDPFDNYWRDLCALVGVDYEQLPIVETTIGRQAVRASYNGGLIAVQRASGIFERTEDIFRQLVAAGLKPWPDGGLTFKTGTGVLGGAATAYWGTSQAAFSIAAVAGNHSVRLLPDTHNFPLHSLDQMTTSVPARLVHLHYHWLFSAEAGGVNPMLDGKVDVPAGAIEWLKARLPLKP
jgi:glycosyltransferase involved in cell wall biosynthesis